MLWRELRDRVLLLELRFGGSTELVEPSERREFLKCVASWAAHTRRTRYCQGAETMLRHWNLVHIVLTILMFVIAGLHIVYGFVYKAV